MSKELNNLKQLHRDANNRDTMDSPDRKLGKLANDTEKYTKKFEDPDDEFNTLKDLGSIEAGNNVYPKDKLIKKDKSYLENVNANDRNTSNSLELLREQPTLDYYVKVDKPGLDNRTSPYYSVSEKDFENIGKQLDKEDIKPSIQDMQHKSHSFNKSKISSGTYRNSNHPKSLNHVSSNNNNLSAKQIKRERSKGLTR